MSNETLRWKLFPFSLKGRARTWYDRTVESKQGDWGSLRSSFCIDFFPIRKVVDVRVKILTFKQLDKESLALAWDHFNLLLESGPDLELQDHVLLQHFYTGLDTTTTEYLTLASGGSFLHLTVEDARKILDCILLDKLPLESDGDPVIEEEKPLAELEPSPESLEPLANSNSEPLDT